MACLCRASQKRTNPLLRLVVSAKKRLLDLANGYERRLGPSRAAVRQAGVDNKIPLSASVVSWLGNQLDPLIECSEVDAQPALALSAHVRGYRARSNFTPIRIDPGDAFSGRTQASANEALSSKAVEV
jgi:hypothetical protein